MTNKQLAIFLDHIAGRIEAEIELVETRLSEDAERIKEWEYCGPELPIELSERAKLLSDDDNYQKIDSERYVITERLWNTVAEIRDHAAGLYSEETDT